MSGSDSEGLASRVVAKALAKSAPEPKGEELEGAEAEDVGFDTAVDECMGALKDGDRKAFATAIKALVKLAK